MDFPFYAFAPAIAVVGVLGVIGWVLTTWMRIKHGYPLDGAWGQAIYPQKNDEAMERIKLEEYVPGEVLQHIPMDRTTYWA